MSGSAVRDSAFNRVFKSILFLFLMVSVSWGIIWSLGQTIKFSVPVVQHATGGLVLGIVIQFSPTAFLYLASSYDKSKKDEWGKWAMWITAFWVVSFIDALTNIGARFDRISINPNYNNGASGFANPDFAVWANRFGIAVGFFVDFGVVFAEELLGYYISVFFDNLGATLRLFNHEPPDWFYMVSSNSARAVGGQKKSPIDAMKNQDRNPGGKSNRSRGGGSRGGGNRGNPSGGNPGQWNPTDRGSRPNVTIMDEPQDARKRPENPVSRIKRRVVRGNRGVR